MTDQISGVENAGLENDGLENGGPENAGLENGGLKNSRQSCVFNCFIKTVVRIITIN